LGEPSSSTIHAVLPVQREKHTLSRLAVHMRLALVLGGERQLGGLSGGGGGGDGGGAGLGLSVVVREHGCVEAVEHLGELY